MVNRVWLEYGALRICLHRIYPANPSKTLFHPHPWPSSMKILKGTYEMGIGFSENNDQPPLAATIILSEGTYYEMIHPKGWHYVCPVENITYSLMISGRPWFDIPYIPPKNLLPLTDKTKEEILDFFRAKYN